MKTALLLILGLFVAATASAENAFQASVSYWRLTPDINLNGYHLVNGLTYKRTFAPIVKLETLGSSYSALLRWSSITVKSQDTINPTTEIKTTHIDGGFVLKYSTFLEYGAILRLLKFQVIETYDVYETRNVVKRTLYVPMARLAFYGEWLKGVKFRAEGDFFTSGKNRFFNIDTQLAFAIWNPFSLCLGYNMEDYKITDSVLALIYSYEGPYLQLQARF